MPLHDYHPLDLLPTPTPQACHPLKSTTILKSSSMERGQGGSIGKQINQSLPLLLFTLVSKLITSKSLLIRESDKSLKQRLVADGVLA